MGLLFAVLRPLEAVNGRLLALGRWLAVVALAVMVVVILAQVFFRYVLDNALPWPAEAARFCMLWMTGLIAPSAYRRGGFVSIDMLDAALPRMAAGVLTLMLLAISGAVLATGISLGWRHVDSGWLFASSSLRLPLGLVGLAPVKIKLAWMYMSLFVGVVALMLVNIELILRQIAMLAGGRDRLSTLPEVAMAEAE